MIGRIALSLALALWAGATFAGEPWLSLVSHEERLEITPNDVAHAELGEDYQGKPALFIRLDPIATRAFGDLTSRIVGKQLKVLHRGEVLTSPYIRTPILGGAIYITGLDEDALNAMLEALGKP